MTEHWTPVQPGTIDCGCDEECGSSLTVEDGYITLENEAGYWSTTLPDNYAVCERVPDNRPRPDWSQAPDWAQWWAVDACGEAHWYDGNPLVFMTLRWGFYEGNKYNRSYAGYVVLPLGIDWRLLKEQRP